MLHFIKRFLKFITNKDNIIPILVIIGTPAGLFFWFVIFPSSNIGNDSLLNTSKNIECGKNIQEALRTFNQNMSMPYKIEPEDYKIIFNKGQIQKEYNRDGIHYTAYFNINSNYSANLGKYFLSSKMP